VSLNCAGAARDPAGKGLEQSRRGRRVGVDHYHGVRPPQRGTGCKCRLERVALAATLKVVSLQYAGTRRARDRGSSVAAVVRDYHDAVPIRRPIEVAQADKDAGDAGRLVVCRDHDIKAKLSR